MHLIYNIWKRCWKLERKLTSVFRVFFWSSQNIKGLCWLAPCCQHPPLSLVLIVEFDMLINRFKYCVSKLLRCDILFAKCVSFKNRLEVYIDMIYPYHVKLPVSILLIVDYIPSLSSTSDFSFCLKKVTRWFRFGCIQLNSYRCIK